MHDVHICMNDMMCVCKVMVLFDVCIVWYGMVYVYMMWYDVCISMLYGMVW